MRRWISTVLRRPAVLMVIGGVATFVLLLVVVGLLWRTDGAKAVSDNAAVIGALVALGGVFTAQMVSIALEAQRAREAALQNYLEQVGKFLIEQPLREASPGDNLSTVVRAQTLSVLENLDPQRQRILLRFLYESELINKNKLVVRLAQANLINADLNGAGLSNTDLSGAYLLGADLSGANLKGANLSGAVLSRPKWSDANLSGANLSGTFVRQDQLDKAYSLEGATMPNGQT